MTIHTRDQMKSFSKVLPARPATLPLGVAALALCAFSCLASNLNAQAPAAAPLISVKGAATLQDARKDVVLAAMLDELERNKAQLLLQDFQRPFFIEYRLEDLTNYEAGASFGALDNEQEEHHRAVRVTVLVGDYKTDSSRGGNGDGSLLITTVEDDPAALRYALWSATDVAYKNALRSLSEKQAELKSAQTLPQAEDFSHEQPVIVLEPLVSLGFDRNAWSRRIVEASGLYRQASGGAAAGVDSAVEFSGSSMSANALNRYLVNTEGTVLRTGRTIYHANLKVSGQAADGMRIERSYNSTSVTAAELASAEEFRSKALETVDTLRQIEQAPLVESEYHGPVLFESHAAANRFEELFAGAIDGNRPALGTEARTTGPFASSYKARVLPDTFNVTDDPTLQRFAGKSLFGAYDVDDEGVPARPVKVVEQGRLNNYLVGRQPIRDFPASNGHGRAQLGAGAAPHFGVLHVEATDGVAPAELLARLLSMGKERGLPNVYVVASPGRIYRVSVADGKRELVRGAEIADVDLRALRSGIIAAGNDSYVLNLAEVIPSTLIAPSLLVDDAIVKRANRKNDKLPYYPPPL
ncbi:MAG TPA: metallopeptidase TldD-related protein [Acidisarcina sp.]